MRQGRDDEQETRVADRAARLLGAVVRLAANERHRHQRELEAAEARARGTGNSGTHAPSSPPQPASGPRFHPRLPVPGPHVGPPAFQQLRVLGEVRDAAADDEERQRRDRRTPSTTASRTKSGV